MAQKGFIFFIENCFNLNSTSCLPFTNRILVNTKRLENFFHKEKRLQKKFKIHIFKFICKTIRSAWNLKTIQLAKRMFRLNFTYNDGLSEKKTRKFYLPHYNNHF